MNRRQLLSAFALALTVAAPRVFAGDAHTVEYTRQVYEQALASGKPFMLDFFAEW
jgi:hypothetical protein